MKNIKQDFEDTLRPEYRRSDFIGAVRGKHAYAEFEFTDIARAFVVCMGEEEGLNFTNHCQGAPRRRADWTYEIGEANQITLRYWLSASANIEEAMSNPSSASNPELRQELQNLLITHIRFLKSKVAASSQS